MSKILVVDDDESLNRLLTTSLQSKNHEVVSFGMGKEAVAFIENPDNAKSLNLLILDRMLPDMDGLEILRTFQEKYGKATPVLVLSSLSAERDVMGGLERGATDYLTKPFSVDILMQKVSRYIPC